MALMTGKVAAGKTGMSATGDADGFTLLEVLVVIAIMALIAGLAFPRIDRMIDGARFNLARTIVAAAVQAARAEAVRTDATVELIAASDGRSLQANGRTVSTLPESVILSGPVPARFFGDGSATGGSLLLAAGAKTAELQIMAPTGTTRWRQ